ncbi:hypothetical protein DFH07DRAFT_278844 [Mycena maculata]|uniref:Uncharacterized protein n=1 Tax=Mycena maculata TaxID=230809 RepID=A0AAD7HLH2_9AGAR|nr:hypothetical protein DFH07DRAFT_278844 [Mycena maculata]
MKKVRETWWTLRGVRCQNSALYNMWTRAVRGVFRWSSIIALGGDCTGRRYNVTVEIKREYQIGMRAHKLLNVQEIPATYYIRSRAGSDADTLWTVNHWGRLISISPNTEQDTHHRRGSGRGRKRILARRCRLYKSQLNSTRIRRKRLTTHRIHMAVRLRVGAQGNTGLGRRRVRIIVSCILPVAARVLWVATSGLLVTTCVLRVCVGACRYGGVVREWALRCGRRKHRNLVLRKRCGRHKHLWGAAGFPAAGKKDACSHTAGDPQEDWRKNKFQ